MKTTALLLALVTLAPSVLAADTPVVAKNEKPKPRLSQVFQNVNRNLGGNREGGATRGTCPAKAVELTALVPDNMGGLTTNERPTLFWYVPPVNSLPLEFRMFDAAGHIIYETTFNSPAQGGLVSLTLPTKTPALAVGKDYSWYFSIACPGGEGSFVSTSGWVQRVEPNPTVLKASAQEQPALYAQSGIWFDTLTSLATLRTSQPTDTSLAEDWRDLLVSLGLGKVANQTLSCVPNPKAPLCP